MKVYNFGSLNIDYVYDVENMVQAGETISSLNFSRLIGGKGLNQSIALAKAGLKVVHIGCIGEDGRFLLNELEAVNVNTDFIKMVNGASGHAIIQVNSKGENCIILYPGANYLIDKEYIDAIMEKINSDDLIVLQNEILNNDYIIEKAYEKKIKIAINLSPVNENINLIDLNKIDYLLINETEGKALTGLDNFKEIGDLLVRKYPGINVVLTLGENGVMFFNKSETILQQAFKTQVVDTTGAGDTFTGYFIAMILKGNDIKTALQTGCYASSLAIQIKGAANSIPVLSDVLTYFNKQEEI